MEQKETDSEYNCNPDVLFQLPFLKPGVKNPSYKNFFDQRKKIIDENSLIHLWLFLISKTLSWCEDYN